MKILVTALCGLVIALLSVGGLYAQEEPIRSEAPSEDRGLAEGAEREKEEIARLKREITDLKERLDDLGKSVRQNRNLLTQVAEMQSAEQDRRRKSAEFHAAERERRRKSAERQNAEQSSKHESEERSRKVTNFSVQHARADELADMLEDLYRTRSREGEAVRIVSDDQTNSIIVAAQATQLDAIAEVLKAADRPAEKQEIKFFRLEKAGAIETARNIEMLFESRQAGEGPQIAVDERTNSIIIKARTGELKDIEAVIKYMDQAESKRPVDDKKDKVKSS